MNQNNELKDYFKKISGDQPVEYLSQFICPYLVGDDWYWIRKATLLLLVTQEGNSSVRSRLHILISGPAGCGKTEFLLWSRRYLGGVFINAELTSKVGLVGDARGKSIKPGLLADYGNNVILIDELDKMPIRDQNGLLQAMEEGRYTIVKGRFREDFDAEVRVIGSTNTLDKIQNPLLDRFDFILYVRPAARGIRADNVGKIVDSFIGHEENKYVKIIKEYLKWVEDYNTVISDDDVIKDIIGKYILGTRTKIDQVSYRSLELSILRIAYAMAKLERKNIGIGHVKDAIVLKDQMLRNLVGYYD